VLPRAAECRIWCHSTAPPVPTSVVARTSGLMSAGGGRPQRVDARAPPRRRSLPSTPNPRHGRRPGEAHRRSAPRFCRLTSGDGGCRWSSSSLKPRGDPATVTRYGSAKAPHQSPVDDQPTGHPAADSGQTTTAPTEPITHQSSHDDRAPGRSTASQPLDHGTPSSLRCRWRCVPRLW
jgi:hypothetical protein